MVKLFVCKICGEPYIGGDAPDDCPFCGAPKSYFGMAEDYSKIWEVEMTETERENMQKTLELEINATAYYQKIVDREGKYSKYNRMYKQFTRVEKEHAEVAAKFMGIDLPEIVGEDTKESIEEDLKRTAELESGAMEMYKEFMETATTEKVKQFYHALIHAENGHYELVS